jgi:chromosome segregation ATPase
MDNVKIENLILEKKMDGYGTNNKNFVAPGELTVTITVEEYRELVSSDATRKQQIAEANADKYDRNQQIAKLTKEVEELKAELYETKKLLDQYKEKEEPDE